MIRFALVMESNRDNAMSIEQIVRMLQATDMLFSIEFRWKSYTPMQALAKNPRFFDVWIVDMRLPDSMRLIKEMRSVNTNADLIPICPLERIRELLSYAPITFFVDSQDMESNAGLIYDALMRIKNRCQQLSFRCEGETQYTAFDQVILIEKVGRNASLTVSYRKNPYIINDTLDALMLQLPSDAFFRCHQSVIVGLRHIVEQVERDHIAWPAFLMDNGQTASISRRNRVNVMQAYRRFRLRQDMNT